MQCFSFFSCGTIYGYEMEVTQGNEKRLTAISFSPRFELHNRSSPSGSTTGIRSLKLLNNSLIILTNDLSDPLGFYDDFPSLISSGKRPSGGTDCIIINQVRAWILCSLNQKKNLGFRNVTLFHQREMNCRFRLCRKVYSPSRLSHESFAGRPKSHFFRNMRECLVYRLKLWISSLL